MMVSRSHLSECVQKENARKVSSKGQVVIKKLRQAGSPSPRAGQNKHRMKDNDRNRTCGKGILDVSSDELEVHCVQSKTRRAIYTLPHCKVRLRGVRFSALVLPQLFSILVF